MEDSSNKAFTAQLLEVQQQFMCYRERSNQRFYELEELIGVATWKMEVLKQKMLKKKRVTPLVNPFEEIISEETQDAKPLHSFELQFPKFTEETGASKWLQDCEEHLNGEVINLQGCEHHLNTGCEHHLNTEPIYDAAPIYDEDPGDTQIDPHEQELILAALQGNSTAFSKPLEFDGEVKGKPVLFLLDGGSSLSLIQRHLYKESKLATTAELVLTLPLSNGNQIGSQGHSTRAPNSPSFEMKCTHLDKPIMLIFDPGGGFMHKDHLQGVKVISKDRSRIEEVMLEKVALQNSAGGQWRQLKGGTHGQEILVVQEETCKVFGKANPYKVTSGRVKWQVRPHMYHYLVLEQTGPELNKPTTPEGYGVSRIRATIYMFDPGGDPSCLHGVLCLIQGEVSWKVLYPP